MRTLLARLAGALPAGAVSCASPAAGPVPAPLGAPAAAPGAVAPGPVSLQAAVRT